MYEYIRGTLTKKTALYAVVEVQGIGYKVCIPTNLLGKLPEIGESTFLYLSWIVREMSQTFYAFESIEERDLFEVLITLSGIGPRTALAIIGHFEISQLEETVRTHDSAALAKIPGIGKKTAERLLIDLKGRLKPSSAAKSKQSSKLQDALQAMINLGYSQAHAEKAINKAMAELTEETDLSSIIAVALRYNH